MGPMKARLSITQQLFSDHEFLFIGEFSNDDISLHEIIQLAMRNGAVVRQKARDFSEYVEQKKQRIVVFDQTTRRFSHEAARLMFVNGRVHCVNKTWLLDSLACYELRDKAEYQTYDMEN